MRVTEREREGGSSEGDRKREGGRERQRVGGGEVDAVHCMEKVTE